MLKYSRVTHIDWIERCLNEGRNLTDWEQDFLSSLSDRLEFVGTTLTEKQEETLERIYCEKVPCT